MWLVFDVILTSNYDGRAVLKSLHTTYEGAYARIPENIRNYENKIGETIHFGYAEIKYMEVTD